MEVSGQRFTPRSLYPKGKQPWYPLDKSLGGPQSRSGRGGEGKHSQPLPALEPPIIQPVAQRYTTELYGLIYFLCINANNVHYLTVAMNNERMVRLLIPQQFVG
jgi:hypothetical protein